MVFVTQYRRKAFTDAMLTGCEEIMREVSTDLEGELKQSNGEEDHVHLLVHYPPKVQPSRWVWCGRRGQNQSPVESEQLATLTVSS